MQTQNTCAVEMSLEHKPNTMLTTMKHKNGFVGVASEICIAKNNHGKLVMHACAQLDSFMVPCPTQANGDVHAAHSIQAHASQ